MAVKDLIAAGIGFAPGGAWRIITRGLDIGSPETAAYYTLAIQVELSGIGGGWTDISNDVLISPPVTIRYGIQGGGLLDRIASTGEMVFALDNSSSNSAMTQGYYSPDNASARAGWEIGIRVRAIFGYDGVDYYKFIGSLDNIQQVAGTATERIVVCTVLDWMDETAKQRTSNIATQTGKRADEIISSIIANMTRQPTSTFYHPSQLEYPYALDTAEDEDTSAMTELSKAVYSDLGYLYLRGDTSAGGVLVYEDRRVRQTSTSPLTTLNDSADMIRISRGRAAVLNRIMVTVHPRRADSAATTVLYSQDSTQFITLGPSESVTIVAQYRDPGQVAQRVGGIDIVSPVPGVDYAFGTGVRDTSLTEFLEVSIGAGGNSAIITLTNNGSVSGFVTMLQIRGRGLYDYDPVTIRALDNASRTAYGEHVLNIDLPHEPRQHVAAGIAVELLARHKSPRGIIESVTFDAGGSASLLSAALAREPGDMIAVNETESGTQTTWFVHGVELSCAWPGLTATWILAPDIETASVFVIGTSQIGGSDVLGW